MAESKGTDGGEGSLSVEITINKQPVTVPGTRATGMEIKQAAIRHGVAISEDFEIAIQIDDDDLDDQIIVDEEIVELREDLVIFATAGDDNA